MIFVMMSMLSCGVKNIYTMQRGIYCEVKCLSWRENGVCKGFQGMGCVRKRGKVVDNYFIFLKIQD